MLQLVEFVAGFSVCLASPLKLANHWLASRSDHASLTHRFIHTQGVASEECWKKNHLERNAEVGVMIQNTTKSFPDGVRLRFGTPGR